MDEGRVFGVGIRGAGQVARQHAEAIAANPHLRLAAVCSRSHESAERLALEFAGAAKKGPPVRVYRHYPDMLCDAGVDIVSECMPNHLHAREAAAAFDAGKHLILEKPAAINREELALLGQACRRAGTRSVVSFVLRWHPLVATIRSLLGRGVIGEPFFSGFDYWHGIKPSFPSYEWIRREEFAGGAMITGGCHAADLARYLKGEVAEVSAYSTRARDDFDYPTTFSAAVNFATERSAACRPPWTACASPTSSTSTCWGRGAPFATTASTPTSSFPGRRISRRSPATRPIPARWRTTRSSRRSTTSWSRC